jgi:hypothetical protein
MRTMTFKAFRRQATVLVAALGLGLGLAAPAFAQTTIHVSPSGDDAASGSADRPVRSLERARRLVRASNAAGDVTVELADGGYRLERPLILSREDGGQNGHSVTWRGADDARPLITSGFQVAGWTLHDADRRIYVADIPKGLDARQVWVDDTLAERPWIEIQHSDLSFGQTGFEIVNPKLSWLSTVARPDRMEVEATGFFTDRFSPVQAITGTTVTMVQPAWDNNTWGYDTLTKPIFPEDSRLFLVNAVEFIGKTNDWHAKPYQFVVDPDAGKLYLRIAQDDDIAKLTVTVPTLELLVSASGAPDRPIENLTFRGLRFSHTSWLGPSKAEGYANQQSGAYLAEVSPIRPADAWDKCGWGCPEFESMRLKWHQAPAAVQVSAARNVTFENNVFSQLGQIALGVGNEPVAHQTGVGLAVRDIRILRNRFAVLSGGAIMVGGVRADAHHPTDPDLILKDVLIENNTIAQVSQEYRDNAAILTTYVDGARIRHNDITDAPYDGIAVGWGWGYNDEGGNPNYDQNQKGYLHNPRYDTPTTLRNTLIENNRIHGIKTWYMDGGAIYNLSSNPGAIIRGNHIFDIGAKIGIYLDEGSKHFRVDGNVIETGGKWLNVNTAGRMFDRGISTDNVATGNWHNSPVTGGRWIPASGNSAEDNWLIPDRDWPSEARAVIDNAGVQP